MTSDEQIDRNINRHLAADHRYLCKMERLDPKADALIGELCRDGKTVYYVNTVSGKTREGSRFDLVEFLIRNKYVR